VVFREDASCMRTGHSARAFTVFRKIALNLLNQERSTNAASEPNANKPPKPLSNC